MLVDENASPSIEEVKHAESQETEPLELKGPEEVQEAVMESTQETVKIPEKFRGKGLDDVIKSYSEAEKEKSRLAQELGETRKQLEAKEAAWQSAQIQSQQQQPIYSQPVKSLEEQYVEEWEADPKQAILNLQARQAYQQRVMAQQAQTVGFYQQAKSGQLKGYEDFAELEPVMVNLATHIAQSYPGLISQEAASHPATIQLLHLAARGLTLNERLNKAQSIGTKKAIKKMEEKEKAFIESSSNSGSSEIPFEALSIEEMRKLLPRAQPEG